VKTDQTTSVTWSVAAGTGAATIDANTGVLTPTAAGTVTVNAVHKTDTSIPNPAGLAITITAPTAIALSDPPAAGIAKNGTHAFTVTATYADGTADVTAKAALTASAVGATAGTGTFAAGTFTGTASGLCTIGATFGGQTAATKQIYSYGGDPGIASFTAVRAADSITLTFTTTYEVKGGVAFLSKKSSFEGTTPILDFQMNILQETGNPTKSHSIVLTAATVSPAITDALADYIRVKVAYQFGDDIFETAVTAVP